MRELRPVPRLQAPRRRTVHVLAGVTAASVILGGLGTATAGGAVASGVGYSEQTYASSQDVVANPERGFYSWAGTHYGSDGLSWTPLDRSQLASRRSREGVTLAMRIIYLDSLVSTDTLPPDLLTRIDADFATARSAGVKLIVRFAYSQSGGGDAAPARTVAHIDQLAPVLNANRDVIEALQAGFIGQYGEWYYSNSYTDDPSTPWLLSPSNWAARLQVLTALLAATDADIPVQVRYPEIKQRLMSSGASAATAARVGVHNDCLGGNYDDQGTFPHAGDRPWLQAQSSTVLVGGETCEAGAPNAVWSVASADLATYHYTFLSKDWHTDVLNDWNTTTPTSWGTGLSEAGKRLGYRLRLERAHLPTSAPAGASATATFTLINDGYAAPVRNRPVNFVLTSAQGTSTVAVPLDLRDLEPGQALTVSAAFTVPATAGSYDLALSLPDPSTSLASTPAYAIQLTNSGTWQPATGLNNLGASLIVSPAPAPVRAPEPTSSPVSPVTAPAPGVHRFGGPDRVATSVAVSRALFAPAASAHVAVIATSTRYADAIAGARLASVHAAPLLLTDTATLQTDVAVEVKRLVAPGGTLYVLGGEDALSPQVRSALAALDPTYTVTRVSGEDRYATAVAIAEHVDSAVTSTAAASAQDAPIYLASGTDYPDGLAVSALTARTGGVVLLTQGAEMPAATRAYLAEHDPSGVRTIPVGGPAAAAATHLPAAAGQSAAAHAVVGTDRYDTARLIAARFTSPVTVVGLTTGENWPDALVGSAAMGELGGPLLLTPGAHLHSATRAAMIDLARKDALDTGLVFGSRDAVSDDTAAAFTNLVPDAP